MGEVRKGGARLRRLSNMDYWERGSHEQGMCPIQDTSRMGAAMVKQEEEVDKNNSNRVVRNMEERNVGTIIRRKTSQTRPN